MPTPHSKLPDVGTTIFAVMSQLAAREGAINLSQGFPDFECPARLRELFAEHMNAGRNQYVHLAGIPELREAIAELTQRCYRYRPDSETEITVMTGATECLFVAFQALVRPGDEVILFDPAYDSYDPAVRLAGGRPVHLPLRAPDFRVDWDRLRDAVNRRTRMIVVNTPHNPGCAVFDESDLRALRELTRDSDILILSDEVYEHIVFDGRSHLSLAADEELRERSISISSFGKTFHTTGWKLGYAIAPRPVTEELRRVHQFVTFCTNAPAQYAYADYLAENPAHYLELGSFYQHYRDRFCDLLAETPFRFTPSPGTYFQLADYGRVSDQDDLAFCRWLTAEAKVAAIPLSPFYRDPPAGQRLVRFCFAKHEATLEQAGERLAALTQG